MNALELDAIDRRVVNALQGGFPVCERPYAAAAAGLDLTEAELMARLQQLLARGALSRFGPLWNAQRLGGAVTLAAMHVPETGLPGAIAVLDGLPQVAHNYERTHHLNLWFVLATESRDEIARCIAHIEQATGLEVFDFPKEEEYFLDLRFEL